MTADDWQKALIFCDRMHLTLALGLAARDRLPDSVRTRIESDLAKSAQRWLRIKTAYREIAAALEADGLEFVVLKGFSHCPLFIDDPRHRFQGDIDLLLAPGQAHRACKIAERLRYEPIIPDDTHPTNHLPTLIRKTGWEWRGDYFDVDMPPSLELHFALWNTDTERFEPAGLDRFWERREQRQLEDLHFVSLEPADQIGHAALHMIRHLLQGSLRLSHAYEMAWMLHHAADDAPLWARYRELHPPSLQRLEAICFVLVERWFDCRIPATAAEAVERLPSEVKRWIEAYSASPVEAKFHPNKNELWLHWNLLDSTAARLDVLRRRLIPERLPGAAAPVGIPKQQTTWRIRPRARWRYMLYASSRIVYHARALPPTAWSAALWFGKGTGLGVQYWRFFFAEAFFDFGMFVFVFLYNLYLLQLGFREDFIGRVSGLMTAGSVAGTLLAGVAVQRFGLRRALLSSFALTALASVLRAYATFPPALLALAFVAGVTAAVWPVAFPPAIAYLTTSKNRALGFSFASSAGIAIGVLGAQAAGRLPGWLSRLHWASSTLASYRASLFAGCVLIGAAIWVFSGVEMEGAPESRRLRRPSPLVIRFLLAMLVWNLGTGALNPFFNVFFSRRVHMPVQQIGIVFSIAQLAQVAAILAAPLVFRRFGLTRAISGMQWVTGLTLVGLAAAAGAVWTAAGYSAYMMSQYMSEPGMFTLLMEGAPAAERGSASALNFLVSFGAQAVAAAVAGEMLARYGYPPVFFSAGVICGLAALLFRALLAGRKPAAPSAP